MAQINLGGSGLMVPDVALGVMRIADKSAAEAQALVEKAMEKGVNFFDTADIYAAGQSSVVLGQALKDAGIAREDIILQSKGGIILEDGQISGDGWKGPRYDFSKSHLISAVDEELKRLQTDYLDLVLLHHPIGDVWGAWRALEELYGAGKIRAIGVSNFSPALLAQFIALNDIAPMVNQIENHPFHQQVDKVAYFQEQGVLVEAWAPFAEGMHDVFHSPILTAIADNHGKSVGHVILRWLLQRGISTIPKSMKPARMRDNLNVFDFELTEPEMAAIATMNTGETLFGGSDDPDVAHVEKMLNWTVTH